MYVPAEESGDDDDSALAMVDFMLLVKSCTKVWEKEGEGEEQKRQSRDDLRTDNNCYITAGHTLAGRYFLRRTE